MQSLVDVLNNYSAKGLATLPPATADEIALLTTIPSQLQTALINSQRNAADYTARGSYGVGIKPFCPWVALFKNSISTSAKHGYYIVLLFAEDMDSCVLSLNQGYSAFEARYKSAKIANKMIRATADEVLKHVTTPQGAVTGRINLSASAHLGQGYEEGAIANYVYSKADALALTVGQFESDVAKLLDALDYLEMLAGTSLDCFTPAFDEDLKDEIAETIKELSALPVPPEPPGAEPPSAPLKANVGGKYPRNSKKSALAILAAGFACENDPLHVSFISKKTGQNYVEAHHLIPMSHQVNPAFIAANLDVRANIISLCPNCHRLLHHASKAQKLPILNNLHAARALLLAGKGIAVTLPQLLSFYAKDVKETD